MIRWADCKTKKQRAAYHAERRPMYRETNKKWTNAQNEARKEAYRLMTGHYWDVLPVEKRLKRLLKVALLCR